MKDIELKKQELYEFCKNYVEGRIAGIKDNLDAIQDSLASETKSSMGDKHETGRAMLHLEHEKLSRQLNEAEKMKMTLQKLKFNGNKKTIALGSWVRTSKETYFLAIPAGEYKFPEISTYCISLQAPIGQLLLGKCTGETIFYRNEAIKILQIA